LSAFDRALMDAGIGNYNLIQLSSIIPEGSVISVGKLNWREREYGYKLYVVLSKQIETDKDREAWAGLGWLTEKSTGKGLFVEHFGSSEEEVVEMIYRSFESMQKYRGEYGEINYKTVGIKCKDNPVCALVCAVFKSEGW